MHCCALAAGLLAVLALSLDAKANEAPPTPPPEVRAALVGKTAVALTTSWEGGAVLSIGAGKGKVLAKGVVAGTVVAGHGIAVCAIGTEKGKPFLVHPITDGKLGKAASVARPDARAGSPFAVIGTATPEGFTIFYQEIDAKNPNDAYAYLIKLDKKGAPNAKAVPVALPWSLGDAIWNGAGYHLALFYPGDQNGMRLSMVSLSEAGVPEQHPDWASAAGYIADVHLFRDEDAGTIAAFYRGGPSGELLLESDVTKIRGWGSEPPKAKRHGALAANRVIAVDGAGKVSRLRR